MEKDPNELHLGLVSLSDMQIYRVGTAGTFTVKLLGVLTMSCLSSKQWQFWHRLELGGHLDVLCSAWGEVRVGSKLRAPSGAARASSQRGLSQTFQMNLEINEIRK